MTDDLTDEDLQLVARHGSGTLERSLATVLYCKRTGRAEWLSERVERASNEDTGGGG